MGIFEVGLTVLASFLAIAAYRWMRRMMAIDAPERDTATETPAPSRSPAPSEGPGPSEGPALGEQLGFGLGFFAVLVSSVVLDSALAAWIAGDVTQAAGESNVKLSVPAMSNPGGGGVALWGLLAPPLVGWLDRRLNRSSLYEVWVLVAVTLAGVAAGGVMGNLTMEARMQALQALASGLDVGVSLEAEIREVAKVMGALSFGVGLAFGLAPLFARGRESARRHLPLLAIVPVVAFVLAGLATPPDIVSQMIVAVGLCFVATVCTVIGAALSRRG